jgi:hypothetical protein
MISSEVERTLVKSPPELWSELSNPDALARHLGEFGDIRITRVEPEHAVEWEAGGTAGTVHIKPSGWGTKVTLTATREITTSEPLAAAEIEPDPVACKAIELEPAPAPALAPQPTPDIMADAMPAPAPAEQQAGIEPSRGFFSRLFGGRRKRRAAEEQPDPFVAVRVALSPETMTAVELFSTPQTVEAGAPDERVIETPPERSADISAELKAAEEVAAEEVTAVLTSVLDRLGAAHHRPFSRA